MHLCKNAFAHLVHSDFLTQLQNFLLQTGFDIEMFSKTDGKIHIDKNLAVKKWRVVKDQ